MGSRVPAVAVTFTQRRIGAHHVGFGAEKSRPVGDEYGVDNGIGCAHPSVGLYPSGSLRTCDGGHLAYRSPRPVRMAAFDAPRRMDWPSVMAVTWSLAAGGVFVQCHPKTASAPTTSLASMFASAKVPWRETQPRYAKPVLSSRQRHEARCTPPPVGWIPARRCGLQDSPLARHAGCRNLRRT